MAVCLGCGMWLGPSVVGRCAACRTIQHLADERERYLLDVFGTRENAERAAHLFVLEEEPIETEIIEHAERNEITMRTTTRYRLRPRTPEEMGADRA